MKVKFIFCRQPFEGSRRDPAADSITYRRRRRRQWQIKTQIFRTNEPLTQSKNQSLLLLKIEPYLSKEFFLNRLSFRSFSRKSPCYCHSAVLNKRKWNIIGFRQGFRRLLRWKKIYIVTQGNFVHSIRYRYIFYLPHQYTV